MEREKKASWNTLGMSSGESLSEMSKKSTVFFPFVRNRKLSFFSFNFFFKFCNFCRSLRDAAKLYSSPSFSSSVGRESANGDAKDGLVRDEEVHHVRVDAVDFGGKSNIIGARKEKKKTGLYSKVPCFYFRLLQRVADQGPAPARPLPALARKFLSPVVRKWIQGSRERRKKRRRKRRLRKEGALTKCLFSHTQFGLMNRERIEWKIETGIGSTNTQG